MRWAVRRKTPLKELSEGEVLLFLLGKGEGKGGRYVVLVVLAGAELSEVLDIVLDADPEDAVVSFLVVQLLAQFLAPDVGIVAPAALPLVLAPGVLHLQNALLLFLLLLGCDVDLLNIQNVVGVGGHQPFVLVPVVILSRPHHQVPLRKVLVQKLPGRVDVNL